MVALRILVPTLGKTIASDWLTIRVRVQGVAREMRGAAKLEVQSSRL